MPKFFLRASVGDRVGGTREGAGSRIESTERSGLAVDTGVVHTYLACKHSGGLPEEQQVPTGVPSSSVYIARTQRPCAHTPAEKSEPYAARRVYYSIRIRRESLNGEYSKCWGFSHSRSRRR